MQIATVGQTTIAPSGGTQVTISTTANTKGAWIQIVAATPFDAHELIVNPLPTYVGTTATSLMDIAVGAAGSEQIIIPNLLCPQDQWCGYAPGLVKIPVAIPAGSRISARAQGGQGISPGVVLSLVNCGGNRPKTGKAIDIGTVLASSSATALALATAAKSSWVQLAAATTQDLDGFFLNLGNNGTSVTASQWAHIDIGVGAAGSEQVVLPDYTVGVDANSEIFLPIYSMFIPVKIPAGQRIAVRGQGQSTGPVYVQLLGVG